MANSIIVTSNDTLLLAKIVAELGERFQVYVLPSVLVAPARSVRNLNILVDYDLVKGKWEKCERPNLLAAHRGATLILILCKA